MKLTESQYERIADSLPRQRGNVSMSNLQLLNALLYASKLIIWRQRTSLSSYPGSRRIVI